MDAIQELLIWQQAIDDYAHNPEYSGIDIGDARQKRDKAATALTARLAWYEATARELATLLESRDIEACMIEDHFALNRGNFDKEIDAALAHYKAGPEGQVVTNPPTPSK